MSAVADRTTRTDRASDLPDSNDDPRGRTAERPTDVPKRGWKDILSRVKLEAKRDNVPLLAAGVAFYSLLALVPAMIAGLSIYGLVADPAEVEGQVVDALAAAPQEVRELVASQLESIAAASSAGTLLATIIGIAVALWSASNGLGKLMTAINIAYDEEETRGPVRLKLIAIGFTLGAILFLAVAFGVIALLPPLLAETGLGSVGRIIAGGVRWVVLLGGMMVALAIMYRYAPDRENPKWRWTSPGAIVAALLWIIGSVAFSIYTANFGKYNETYGTLAAVVVVMLWLFLTSASVIIGAELNAEIERQTLKDTTEGTPQPLGQRDAYAADTVGETAEEVKAAKKRGAPQGGGKDPGETAAGSKGVKEPAGSRVPADLRGGDARAASRNGGPNATRPRPAGGGERGEDRSTGAIPAAVGLSVLGIAMKAGRKLLERRGGSRS
jgi:membrane protein